MNWLRRPTDTITRWVALTIALAMAAALLLNALFMQLAGVWARPPLTQSGLLEQIAISARIIAAAPAALRPELARAGSAENFAIHWFTSRQQVDLPQEIDEYEDGHLLLLSLLGGIALSIEAYSPDDWPPPNRDRPYVMAMQLQDHSWLTFSAPDRSWGLDATTRYSIILALGLIAALVVAWLATRRLATPLQLFARGAKRFGSDFRAPPIEPIGPQEIRQAILAFNTMQAQIQHFVADRSQMLAAISHDLRAPLTRMRLRGEFIDDSEQQRKLFRDVDEMQSMINAALDFFRDDARLEAATPFDLAELLQTLSDDYRDQAIELPFHGPAKLVYIGRPVGLKRVITNLVENALKYAHSPVITLKTGPEGLEIDVSDAGPGIPEHQLEQVFEPFVRLDSSRNPNSGGVGLGLSAARAIVREHGGELRLHNRAEGGLVARVQLPWN
jgi:signal transduction histidine kinase